MFRARFESVDRKLIFVAIGNVDDIARLGR
jgi:hypothetical protein